jgi:hypothetical protein
LNGTPQLLAYADDVTVQGNNIDTTIKKNIVTLVDATYATHILLARHQKADQNRDIKITSR